MNSFPVITNNLLLACFSDLCILYAADLVKLLHAAQAATFGEPAAFTIIPGVNINTQIGVIEAKVKRTADGYGQKFLIKILEHLYDELQANGAIGVTDAGFLDCTKITLQDGSEVQYTKSKKWRWIWKLEVEGNPGSVDLDIRSGNATPGEIVPGYILQYIQQGVAAFKSGKHAVAMSLMSIALEGTLRDALDAKGYSYQYGAPSQDVYEIKDMDVHKEASGYKVTFPNPMPKADTDYLAASGDPTYKTYRIKRVKKTDGSFILEIRSVADLVDYWSSDQVTATGVKQVSGLGSALDIGRNHLNIITPIDIPEDLDKPIQQVRNNLIHLSGASMSEVVQQDPYGNDVTLASFLNNKNQVFDAICTIGSSINTIYNKRANGTL
jgi:hypothetical protein